MGRVKSSKERIIKITISEELYEKLREKAVSRGYINVEDYILEIIKENLKEEVVDIETIVEKIRPRVRRLVEDSLNIALKELFELKNRVAELYERIERLENELRKLREEKPQQLPQTQRRRRKTGIEILHDQKVLYESKLERLRDRDRFFDYLKRQGAIVLELMGERVAVDPEFWNMFLDKLSSVKTPDPLEVKNYLSPIEYELFRKLRDSQLLIYDSRRRLWRFVESR